jgi:hypothetical protein
MHIAMQYGFFSSKSEGFRRSLKLLQYAYCALHAYCDRILPTRSECFLTNQQMALGGVCGMCFGDEKGFKVGFTS